MTSRVAERLASGFARWVAAEAPARDLRRFRVAFAVVWLAYDAIDLATGATAHQLDPVDPFPGVWALRALQCGLVLGELSLLAGVRPRIAAGACAAIRALFAWRFFPLNDFLYYSVTAGLLALARSGARADELVPRWPRDLLVAQAGWTYLATGLLKLQPTWLSGGHLYVRMQYLAAAHGWPYPPPLARCAASLPCDAALAWSGAAAELLLGVLLLARAPRRWVAPIAVAIHVFAALALDVFFFGASMLAQVLLLVPPRRVRSGPLR